MKTRAIAILLALLLPVAAFGQVAIHTVDATDINLGFMNVFDLGGTFLWGSPWGFVDLVANYSGPNLILEPNRINDPDPYWYDGSLNGQKLMEANGYAEVNGPYAGVTVNFSFEVLSNTLTSAHTVKAFVKDYAPDFSSFVESSVLLTGPGHYAVSLTAINDAGRHVQWGFQMYGVNVHPTLADQFGSMVLGPDPQVVPSETTSFGDVKSLFR